MRFLVGTEKTDELKHSAGMSDRPLPHSNPPQPLFVLPMAAVFLHQIPKPLELIGGCFILAGGSWLTLLHVNQARSVTRSRTPGGE